MEENLSIYEDEKLNKLKEFSGEIILRFVQDKFTGKVEIEDVKTFIEKTRMFIDNKTEKGIGGSYYPSPDKSKNMPITMNPGIVKNEELTALLGTIIHELQHKFSAEFARGEKISKQIEEGFSDVFEEECLNYFMQVEPQRLEEFANSEEIKYNKKRTRYVSQNDYIGERSFIKSILEAIRQTTGKHYEAEFEYTFGDKNAFVEIVGEALGDECVELMLEQGKDTKGLAGKYEYLYNKRLQTLLEKIPLTYKMTDSEEIDHREDGTYNVYDSEIIRSIAIKQELTNLLKEEGFDLFNLTPEGVPTLKKILEQKHLLFSSRDINEKILQGFIPNCIDATQLNALLEIGDDLTFRGIIGKNFDYFLKTSKMNIQDILYIIGSNCKLYESVLTDETIQLLSTKISELDIEKLTNGQITALSYLGVQANTPNKELSEKLTQIDATKKMPAGMHILTGIAKIKTDEHPKGKKWSELIEKYCLTSPEMEDIPYLLVENINGYFENDAKDDIEGSNAIIEFIRKVEAKEERRRRIIRI